MVFIVNGTDIVPFVTVGGISWKRVNVDGGNGMIMQDGTDYQDRIATRYEWSLVFKPMTASNQADLLNLLNVKTVSIQCTDPQTGSESTDSYYVSEIPASYLIKRTDGTEWWGGLTVTFSSMSVH